MTLPEGGAAGKPFIVVTYKLKPCAVDTSTAGNGGGWLFSNWLGKAVYDAAEGYHVYYAESF
ncbi:MAG: hypothetical protein LBK67_01560 [Coriobacteriales bacterium]|jgi:hypothetical protein|nr:hypothetical protein [Coriobacteriales bacterium]